VRLDARDATGEAIALTGTTTVRARALRGNEWSALAEATYFADTPLRIAEIHYHPADASPDSPFDADDFEFVELLNVAQEPIALAGIRLEGAIGLALETSPGAVLAPGAVVLAVRDLDAFFKRYDFATIERRLGDGLIVGPWVGRLANDGETLRLRGAHDEVILEVPFDDAWYPETDGGGRSLEIVDELAAPESWRDRASWRANGSDGDTGGGTPGEHRGASPPGGAQLPGDATQDGTLDLSDAVRLLRWLFLEGSQGLPCDGSLEAGGNRELLDANGDTATNLSDAVFVLAHLFLGGPPHRLGSGCVVLRDCTDTCGP